LRPGILPFAAPRRDPPSPLHDPTPVDLPTVTESAAPGEDFIPAGLAALGIEADETDLAVMAAFHALLWPPLTELLALDTADVEPERCPDLSRRPE
jgi:hypothetical protein